MQKTFTILFLCLASTAFAQKKPLDHSVYDSWENIASKQLSNNGLWAAFSIAQQEGDSKLTFNSIPSNTKIVVPRAGMLKFSADSKYAAFLIKPVYADTRMAKIKKKKPDRKSTRLNSSHSAVSRMPSSA